MWNAVTCHRFGFGSERKRCRTPNRVREYLASPSQGSRSGRPPEGESEGRKAGGSVSVHLRAAAVKYLLPCSIHVWNNRRTCSPSY